MLFSAICAVVTVGGNRNELPLDVLLRGWRGSADLTLCHCILAARTAIFQIGGERATLTMQLILCGQEPWAGIIGDCTAVTRNWSAILQITHGDYQPTVTWLSFARSAACHEDRWW